MKTSASPKHRVLEAWDSEEFVFAVLVVMSWVFKYAAGRGCLRQQSGLSAHVCGVILEFLPRHPEPEFTECYQGI